MIHDVKFEAKRIGRHPCGPIKIHGQAAFGQSHFDLRNIDQRILRRKVVLIGDGKGLLIALGARQPLAFAQFHDQCSMQVI